MDEAELDVIHEAGRSTREVDLPDDRRDLALLGTFLERNPSFDTSAPDEKYEQLRALQGADRDVYVPEDDADMERLIALLKRHEDLALLQELVGADDAVAVLAALGHGDGVGAAGDGIAPAGDSGTTSESDEGGGWLSDDDEDDFLDHEDLDAFGERLAWGAGGLVCLTALLAAYLTGFTVYKDVDSWILTVEFHGTNAILLATAVVALLASVSVGFVYRVVADEGYDGYRGDLAAATFEVPLFGFIAAGLLYLVSPILLNLVNLFVVDAVTYLVGLVILLVVAGVPLLLGVFLAVGLVVGVPVYAGVFGGSLLGMPLAVLAGGE